LRYRGAKNNQPEICNTYTQCDCIEKQSDNVNPDRRIV
jgi:hypothetical protein